MDVLFGTQGSEARGGPAGVGRGGGERRAGALGSVDADIDMAADTTLR